METFHFIASCCSIVAGLFAFGYTVGMLWLIFGWNVSNKGILVENDDPRMFED